MRVDGSVRVLIDGVNHDIEKGGKLPEGQLTLLTINLDGCEKATDDGRDYLRGLNRLRSFTINSGSQIRNFDFLADMVNLEVLSSEGGPPCLWDKDLIHIKGLTNLRTLQLTAQFGNPELTDKALEMVKELKKLETLRLACCNISDAGLRYLEGHGSLRTLDFWNTKISDTGLESLATLPKLDALYLQDTQVTDAGVKSIQAKIPNCKIIK